MMIEFTAKRLHKHILATAALVFGAGPLEGLRLEGFTIWKSKLECGDPFITFPSAKTAKNHFYWYLRPTELKDESAVYRLRQIILTQYMEWAKSQEGAEPEY